MENRSNRIGQRLGNYHLTRLLGEGSFAEVYLGEHVHLNTLAAIKVLHTRLTSNDIETFRAEARTIARLVHPHIVRVLDFGVEGKTPFLVMDYATGGTVRQQHPRGEILPLEKVVSYVGQIAEALRYAHSEKVIHRDIKPENILLNGCQQVLLSDFGIALTAQSSLYQAPQGVTGTIAYMAPEQIQGRACPASDQYALGIVVYEWLCGDRPFHGSFTELCTQHLFARPPSLREKAPTISPVVEFVVTKALAKDPEDRFASVKAFAVALEQASQSKPMVFPSGFPDRVEEPPSEPEEETVPWSRVAAPVKLVKSGSPFDTIPATDGVSISNLSTTVFDARLSRKKHSLRRVPVAAMIAFVIALVVILLGASGLFYEVEIYQPGRAHEQASATAWARSPQGIYARATSGVPVLDSPLAQQDANNWDVLTYSGGGGCDFSGGAYHITMPQQAYFAGCMARATNFSDFAFQVEMTTVAGDGGGLIFRTTGDRTYRFRVGRNRDGVDGTYDLVSDRASLLDASSPAIHTGLNQKNVLTVVARGQDIYLYVNGQFVNHVSDDRASSGQIGLLAIDFNNPTDVMFKNAKVWKL